MATIADICAVFEALIIAGGPVYRTDVGYKLAPKHCPLRELPVASTWFDTTRSFRVVPTPRIDEGQMNGFDVDTHHEVEIHVRYQLDSGAIDADATLQAMAACDARRIVNLVLRPNAASSIPVSPAYYNAFFRDASGPEETELSGVFLLTITLDAVYLSAI